MKSHLARLRRRLFPPKEIIEGYDQPELVELIFKKSQAYEPEQADWPLIAGVSTVLDFGGAFGRHYKLARKQEPSVRWAVVETPPMVARAAELHTDRLRFFADIDSAAAWLGGVDLMHSEGALQYVPDPIETLHQLCALRAPRMFWQRLAFAEGDIVKEVQSSYLGDNGPGYVPIKREKIVQYQRTRIPEADFMGAHKDYAVEERGPDWFRFALRR
jgi:putative methyltransferase (TIGR04325 family)